MNETNLAVSNYLKVLWEQIEDLQGRIMSIENDPEIKAVFDDILNDSYMHVGQLEDLLSSVAPEITDQIDDGREGVEESLNESAKIITGLDSYKPWGTNATAHFKAIEEAGKLNELDALLEDCYEEGVSETELNDMLAYDFDWVCEQLGMDLEEGLLDNIKKVSKVGPILEEAEEQPKDSDETEEKPADKLNKDAAEIAKKDRNEARRKAIAKGSYEASAEWWDKKFPWMRNFSYKEDLDNEEAENAPDDVIAEGMFEDECAAKGEDPQEVSMKQEGEYDYLPDDDISLDDVEKVNFKAK